jgi:hypothetical protein
VALTSEVVGQLRELDGQIAGLLGRRTALLARLAADQPPLAPSAGPGPTPGPHDPTPARRLSAQRLLLVSGVSLLAVAAVGFAAVVFTTIGVLGQALVLLALCAAAAAASRLCARRGLEASAEALAVLAVAVAVVVVAAAHAQGLLGLDAVDEDTWTATGLALLTAAGAGAAALLRRGTGAGAGAPRAYGWAALSTAALLPTAVTWALDGRAPTWAALALLLAVACVLVAPAARGHGRALEVAVLVVAAGHLMAALLVLLAVVAVHDTDGDVVRAGVLLALLAAAAAAVAAPFAHRRPRLARVGRATAWTAAGGVPLAAAVLGGPTALLALAAVLATATGCLVLVRAALPWPALVTAPAVGRVLRSRSPGWWSWACSPGGRCSAHLREELRDRLLHLVQTGLLDREVPGALEQHGAVRAAHPVEEARRQARWGPPVGSGMDQEQRADVEVLRLDHRGCLQPVEEEPQRRAGPTPLRVAGARTGQRGGVAHRRHPCHRPHRHPGPQQRLGQLAQGRHQPRGDGTAGHCAAHRWLARVEQAGGDHPDRTAGEGGHVVGQAPAHAGAEQHHRPLLGLPLDDVRHHLDPGAVADRTRVGHVGQPVQRQVGGDRLATRGARHQARRRHHPPVPTPTVHRDDRQRRIGDRPPVQVHRAAAETQVLLDGQLGSLGPQVRRQQRLVGPPSLDLRVRARGHLRCGHRLLEHRVTLSTRHRRGRRSATAGTSHATRAPGPSARSKRGRRSRR